MRWWTAAAAVIILAGCAAPEAAPSPDPNEGPSSPPPTSSGPGRWSPPIRLGTVNGGAEPTLVAAPDGTLYAATPKVVFRSDDGGRTWQTLGSSVCPQGLPTCPGLEEAESDVDGPGDADLWVSPTGRVHWMGLNAPDAWIPYQYSDDRGKTWSPAVELAADGEADRAWISGTVDGILHGTWREYPADGSARMIVHRSSVDGGTTWGDFHDVVPFAATSPIEIDPMTGALLIAYDTDKGVHVARSVDQGVSWNTSTISDEPRPSHIFPSLAIDQIGTAYVVYAVDRDGLLRSGALAQPDDAAKEEPSVFFSASKDGGITWTKPRQVNAAGTTAWFPWIAAGAAGRVVITWYQNDRGMPRQLTDNVYVMAAISIDAAAEHPTFSIQRVDPQPNHQGPECRSSTGCTRSLLDFFEVAIHPDGFPAVAWATDTWPVSRTSVMFSRLVDGPNLLEAGVPSAPR